MILKFEVLKRLRNWWELFEKITKYLENTFFSGKWKYKQHIDIFKVYNEHFSFTFSELEIFKRLYYRYMALINKDFNDFYKDHKDLDKKKFLKKLEKYLDKFLVK